MSLHFNFIIYCGVAQIRGRGVAAFAAVTLFFFFFFWLAACEVLFA